MNRDKLNLDDRKIEDAALAILYLNYDQNTGRTWKSLDWDIGNQLFQRGLISDPKTKNKSVIMTEEGITLAEAVLKEFFSR